jgi:hypothetical protein
MRFVLRFHLTSLTSRPLGVLSSLSLSLASCCVCVCEHAPIVLASCCVCV